MGNEYIPLGKLYVTDVSPFVGIATMKPTLPLFGSSTPVHGSNPIMKPIVRGSQTSCFSHEAQTHNRVMFINRRKNFDFIRYNAKTFFGHLVSMLLARNCL